jgi:hypothetical protein
MTDAMALLSAAPTTPIPTAPATAAAVSQPAPLHHAHSRRACDGHGGVAARASRRRCVRSPRTANALQQAAAGFRPTVASLRCSDHAHSRRARDGRGGSPRLSEARRTIPTDRRHFTACYRRFPDECRHSPTPRPRPFPPRPRRPREKNRISKAKPSPNGKKIVL